jgi:DNA/RNA endonuclease YhcR with UshA esterase domain
MVRAGGQVSQYEGQLQVEPDFGGDVKALAAGAASAPRREIGSISGTDEGQWVLVEGEVVRVEGLESAVKVFVREDGAAGPGEIAVFIWRNVLDRIPDNVGLGTEGSRVRVVGAVAMYRGTLEIVPTLPYDVVVLEIP